MSQRAVNRKGWGTRDNASGAITPAELPALQPQWIGAGAWEPLSTNTELVTTPQEFTGAGDIAYTTIKFIKTSTDEWFFITTPPVGWTSGKIKFIPHYLVVDSLDTPQTMIFELGAEFMADEFLPNVTTAFQTVTSTKTAGIATVPQYVIGTESAELTLTGNPAASGAIALRMKRGSDAESDPLYFVGCFLEYV